MSKSLRLTYPEVVGWMFQCLPMYQLQGSSAYKADLSNAVMLAKHLGNPESSLKFIHVAGTNGKGSTSHMLASILQEAGYKTGLFTSPHLKDFTERIRINGVVISEEFVTEFISTHKVFFESHQMSFFEMSVGLALSYFSDNKVDIAVMETGLGGRLDATNIINPIVSVITNIGLDHTSLLGSTISAIAEEKAGIIKPGIPVVIGEYDDESNVVFNRKAKLSNSEIIHGSELTFADYVSDLTGAYQAKNRKTVLATIEILKRSGFTIPDEAIRYGMLNVTVNTGLQGRWQQLRQNPTVICDTAHNTHGLRAVLAQIKNQRFDTLHMVLGFVNDKDLESILPLFPTDAVYYFAKPDIPRGLAAPQLEVDAHRFGLNGSVYNSVAEAYQSALQNAGPSDFIYVGGSTFVVAEIL